MLAGPKNCAGRTTGRHNVGPGIPVVPALKAYYAAMLACGADLLRAVAVSLEQDADFFLAAHCKPLQRT